MTQKQSFQRKTIFIKKGLQIQFMLLILASLLAGLAIMSFEIVDTLNELFDQYPSLMQPLYENFTPIIASFCYKIAIYILFVILVSAVLSHKIAGPIYRFEQTCKEIAKGDLSKRVFLRKGDHLTDLQKEFNTMMDSIEKKEKDSK